MIGREVRIGASSCMDEITMILNAADGGDSEAAEKLMRWPTTS